MQPYRNHSGEAGVIAYEYGEDWIRLRFIRGSSYTYSAAHIGKANVIKMKKLADAGKGLTTFINRHPEVKNGYS
jgi:hypothetical protein